MWISIISKDEDWCWTKYAFMTKLVKCETKTNVLIWLTLHTTRGQHLPNIITTGRSQSDTHGVIVLLDAPWFNYLLRDPTLSVWVWTVWVWLICSHSGPVNVLPPKMTPHVSKIITKPVWEDKTVWVVPNQSRQFAKTFIQTTFWPHTLWTFTYIAFYFIKAIVKATLK